MNDADRIEVEAVRKALADVVGSALTGDALLNAAIERAGYDVEESRIEQCANCGTIFHSDYGGEYVDPRGCSSLQKELRVRGMRKLHRMHFCDFSCLQEQAHTLYQPY